MTKMYKYYKIDADSEVGRRLADFHKRAADADTAAEAYAVEMGAVAYIQPAQYFAGGVEFLEFGKPVSTELWRVRQISASNLYEPNCQVVTGMMMLTGDQSIPEDSETVIYGKYKLKWQDVYSVKPIGFWSLLLGYSLTGDNLVDWKFIDGQMADMYFVTTLEYKGEKEAVEAERKRVLLPVVETSDFYEALGVGSFPEVETTPVFFIHDNTYYIMLPDKCQSSSAMTSISESEYAEAEMAVRTDHEL